MEKIFKTFDEAHDYVRTICESYALVLDQPLISNDIKKELAFVSKMHYENQDYCPWHSYVYWIAIRERGVEGAMKSNECSDVVSSFNDITICAIKWSYNSEDKTITISRKQRKVKF